MNLKRTADQAGFFGTIVFHALLVFFIMLLMVKCNTEEPPDPLDGAVAVSIGEPDYGGPDQSTSEVTETAPTEESTTEEQVTSDVEDAPEVQETQSTTNQNTTPSEPTQTTTPRQADPRNAWKPGTGSGTGDGDQSGDQGKPDGQPDGQPDGTGTGTGGEGFAGDGFSGKISGFKAVGTYKPENTQQQFGKIVVKVCVDKNGKIISVKGNQPGSTNTSAYLTRLSEQAARKFKFQRIGTATNINCGYITFNYKRG
ncbi:MAG: hypothetical protein JXR19_01095 [Bacteroidia bacterium]